MAKEFEDPTRPMTSQDSPEKVLFSALNGLINLGTKTAKNGNIETAKRIADFVQEKLDYLSDQCVMN